MRKASRSQRRVSSESDRTRHGSYSILAGARHDCVEALARRDDTSVDDGLRGTVFSRSRRTARSSVEFSCRLARKNRRVPCHGGRTTQPLPRESRKKLAGGLRFLSPRNPQRSKTTKLHRTRFTKAAVVRECCWKNRNWTHRVCRRKRRRFRVVANIDNQISRRGRLPRVHRNVYWTAHRHRFDRCRRSLRERRDSSLLSGDLRRRRPRRSR